MSGKTITRTMGGDGERGRGLDQQILALTGVIRPRSRHPVTWGQSRSMATRGLSHVKLPRGARASTQCGELCPAESQYRAARGTDSGGVRMKAITHRPVVFSRTSRGEIRIRGFGHGRG